MRFRVLLHSFDISRGVDNFATRWVMHRCSTPAQAINPMTQMIKVQGSLNT
jgi:hypothetical protein